MTAFVKPSTITNESGAYNYKGQLSSPSLNYIDNNFPNLMDINGNNIFSGTNTVTGEINYSGSASSTFGSGTTLTITAGASLAVAGDLGIDPTGSLILFSGSIVEGNINFPVAQSTPTISQVTSTTGNGNTLLLQAQSTTFAGGGGGNAILSAGTGGSGGNGGNAEVVCGGTNSEVLFKSSNTILGTINTTDFALFPNTSGGGQSLQVLPWQGIQNSQNAVYSVTPFYARTTVAGQSQILPQYYLANSTVAIFDIFYTCRALNGQPAISGNRVLCIALCNSSGAVTTNISPVITTNANNVGAANASYAPGDGTFDVGAIPTSTYMIVATTTTNGVIFSVANPYSFTMDWQVVVSALYC